METQSAAEMCQPESLPLRRSFRENRRLMRRIADGRSLSQRTIGILSMGGLTLKTICSTGVLTSLRDLEQTWDLMAYESPIMMK